MKMYDTEFYDKWKVILDDLKNVTLNQLLKSDSDYLTYSKQESSAETEYATLAYLAGLLDSLRILRYLNLTP